MADYNAILPTETDPGAPIRSSLMKRLEANPRAIAEGAAGATRINPGALRRVSAGDTLRANVPDATSGNSSRIGFFQNGSVRLKMTQGASSGSGNKLFVNRIRGKSTTQLQAWPRVASNTARTLDVNVQPGDIIEITFSAPMPSVTSNITVNTAGEDFFPMPGVAPIEVVGNTYA